MLRVARVPGSALFVTTLAVLALSGCASSSPHSGSSMMNGTGSSASNSTGPGMMGGGSDYHYSSLSCAAPKSLPGRIVTVTLADMGMTRTMGGTAPMGAQMVLNATPTTAPAGQITFVVSNLGWRTHELVILPLAAGAGAGQRVPGSDGKVNEAGSLGESSNSCAAGTGDGLTSGTVGWTTLTLAAGRYEMVCNLANHYADGMHQELVVA